MPRRKRICECGAVVDASSPCPKCGAVERVGSPPNVLGPKVYVVDEVGSPVDRKCKTCRYWIPDAHSDEIGTCRTEGEASGFEYSCDEYEPRDDESFDERLYVLETRVAKMADNVVAKLEQRLDKLESFVVLRKKERATILTRFDSHLRMVDAATSLAERVDKRTKKNERATRNRLERIECDIEMRLDAIESELKIESDEIYGPISRRLESITWNASQERERTKMLEERLKAVEGWEHPRRVNELELAVERLEAELVERVSALEGRLVRVDDISASGAIVVAVDAIAFESLAATIEAVEDRLSEYIESQGRPNCDGDGCK